MKDFSKQLEKELIELLQKSKVGIIKGIGKAQEVAPELIADIFRWEVIKRSMWVFGHMLGLGTAILVFAKIGIWVSGLEEQYTRDTIVCIVRVLSGVGIVAFFFGLVDAIWWLLKPLLCPKLFLLEYISNKSWRD